ncbi:hypothetical protein, partial [Pseudoalteromonas sp. T1lg21]|uniref:hypothetical protein n=1 Tax=Pseudoalteromonas sp. T1lg21 TaxID=2077095 RepID=UPI001F330609
AKGEASCLSTGRNINDSIAKCQHKNFINSKKKLIRCFYVRSEQNVAEKLNIFCLAAGDLCRKLGFFACFLSSGTFFKNIKKFLCIDILYQIEEITINAMFFSHRQNQI